MLMQHGPATAPQSQFPRPQYKVCQLGSVAFEFRIYSEPGNAYAYLPYWSYHARQSQMQRLLTHSSCTSVWLEECSIFYVHLCNRGYPARAIDSCFWGFNWNQQRKMLVAKLRKRSDDDSFFNQYRGRVFSSHKTLGVNHLRGSISL